MNSVVPHGENSFFCLEAGVARHHRYLKRIRFDLS